MKTFEIFKNLRKVSQKAMSSCKSQLVNINLYKKYIFVEAEKPQKGKNNEIKTD